MWIQSVLSVCLVGLSHGQLWGMSRMGNMGMGNMGQMGIRSWGQPMTSSWGVAGGASPQVSSTDNRILLTCINRNQQGDEMRITFSQGSRDNQVTNMWGGVTGNWGGQQETRVSAVISAGQTSMLNGQYQLVATQRGRVEDGCFARSLGDILSDQNPQWWGQSRSRARGRIGNPIFLTAGQTATTSESLEQLTLEDLNGRAIALCRVDQMTDTACFGQVGLCCKNGRDSQPATSPFMGQGQMFGGQGFGLATGVNGGFAAGGTIGTGLNQGIAAGGINTGLAQGTNAAVSPLTFK